MVASRAPLDVAQDPPTRVDTSPAAATSSVSTSPPAPPRPLLPAERDINAAMNGFNAGVVNFLKGKLSITISERSHRLVFFFFQQLLPSNRSQVLPD